MENQTKN